MATLNEHVYAVQHLLNAGPVSQSRKYPDRLVAHFLKSSRSILLKRKIERGTWISEQNYVTICVPLEKVEYADCPGCNLPDTGCTLYRSTITIPRSIVVKHKDTFRVRTITGTIVSRFTLTNNQYDGYSNASDENFMGWFIVGERLYILSDNPITLVLLELIPEDPEEISDLDPCKDPTEDAPCILSSQETFPIDGDLVDAMYDMTMKRLLVSERLPQDNVNNSKYTETIQDKEN